MCRDFYAISYYGEQYKLGYINMDFLDCETVDRYIGEEKDRFWRAVHIIAAEVPYSTYYKKYIGINEKTLRRGGALFRVKLEETEKTHAGFSCDIYSQDGLVSRQSRIKIIDAERCSVEEGNRIINDLNNKFDISEVPEYDGSEGVVASHIKGKLAGESSNKRFLFTTYKVGQGLATSIQVENEIPFMYFDYGTDKDPSKVPRGLTLKVDIKETVIFISHVDEDHWCGCRINPQALLCTWVIPDQRGSAIYQKTISTIKSRGGIIFRHTTDIDLGSIYIGHSASTIRPSRVPKNVHQDGLAMYVNARAYDDSANLIEYKITVSGDQDYDYQDATKYGNSDALVACHHGGEYCWSSKYAGIYPRDNSSIVIYSYGLNNKYGHPNKTNAYYRWGWKIRHDTAFIGSYVKSIYF